MSPIDELLDRLFDGLTGTGAAGRRAMAEAEDHLREAAAAGEASGLDAQQAEAAAVRAFGPIQPVVRAAQRRSRGPFAFARLLSGGWLFAGLVAAALGVACATRVADIVVLGWMYPERGPQCDPSAFVFPATGCSLTASAQRTFTLDGGLLIGLALALLVSRWLLIRRGWLAPAGRITARTVGTGLLMLSVAASLLPAQSIIIDNGPGFQFPLVAAVAGFAVTGVFGIHRMTAAGHRPHRSR